MRFIIQDIAFGGAGVARWEGLAVFIPYTLPGEEVEAEIRQRKKRYAHGELSAVLQPSADRVPPPCPYFGRCGGCAYQMAAYPAQLAIKSKQVKETLHRIGKFETVPMRPILPSPKPYGNRNRIRVHLAGGVIGFYSADGHTLLDVDHCPIASDAVNQRLRALRKTAPLEEGDRTLAEGPAAYFEQTNPGVAEALLRHVENELTGAPTKRLVDAYSGAGFFASRLRGRFEEILGIEANPRAVAHAREHATPGERHLCGDVAALLPELLETEPDATTLLLDPPAAGLPARVLDTIAHARPARLHYVSCNPGTLARDLAFLRPHYTLKSVTPLDMFPQTAEVEVSVMLERRPT